MTTLTEIQIKQIADELVCGFTCYYNSVTGELLFIPDEDKHLDIEAWKDDLKKIKKNSKQFRTILPPDTPESFEIMVEFIKSLRDNISLKETLQQALTRKKPFRQFKFEIDNSGEYRQKWFDFKTKTLQDHVKSQLDNYNELDN